MENTFFLLIILIAVVAAVIMHHHLNHVPLPIVFIVVGILLTLLPLYHHYIFNPNLFLFFIVAPLLYNEAQSASRYWIGRGASGIISLSLAFLLPTINGHDLTTDRNALIFVVTVVILNSLTVAAIAVPIITKMPTGTQTKPISQWTREMIMTAMNRVRSNKDAHRG